MISVQMAMVKMLVWHVPYLAMMEASGWLEGLYQMKDVLKFA